MQIDGANNTRRYEKDTSAEILSLSSSGVSFSVDLTLTI